MDGRSISSMIADHVFGAGAPCGSLLDKGEFPTGWAIEYLRLLSIAQEEWAKEPAWPKELVASVHFASWYLNLRYEVWRSNTGRQNPQTEKDLASLRSPSEIFLMHGSLGLPK